MVQEPHLFHMLDTVVTIYKLVLKAENWYWMFVALEYPWQYICLFFPIYLVVIMNCSSYGSSHVCCAYKVDDNVKASQQIGYNNNELMNQLSFTAVRWAPPWYPGVINKLINLQCWLSGPTEGWFLNCVTYGLACWQRSYMAYMTWIWEYVHSLLAKNMKYILNKLGFSFCIDIWLEFCICRGAHKFELKPKLLLFL